MSIKRVIAIVAIYLLACMGWFILGSVTKNRSSELSYRLHRAVHSLWGGPITQHPPSFRVRIPGTNDERRLMPKSNEVDVAFDLEHRRKGLIWYATYTLDFSARYVVQNDEEVSQKVRFHFDFPSPSASYDDFTFSVDEERVLCPIDTRKGVSEVVIIPPGQERSFTVSYRSRGLDRWQYYPSASTGRVRNLRLSASTNFHDLDYPESGLSPMEREKTEQGWKLTWKARDLITSQNIGIIVPDKINPGPLASRITFFAPVCLLFFFTLIAAINVVYRVDIHPMHYLFVAAGFFSFHLLLAYLVDHIDLHLAFILSAVTSIVLVTTYLTASLGEQFPAFAAVLGQSFFLVLFSYSFFLEGATGLTVAIGSVITLAVLMKVTVNTNWNDFFSPENPAP